MAVTLRPVVFRRRPVEEAVREVRGGLLVQSFWF
jgi:hypothetical protein